MSRSRLAVALFAVLVVGGLVTWQAARERRVEACQAAGGEWHGATSRCLPGRAAPILRRDRLERT